MPSFDVVSEVDKHELVNAVDQVNREIGNRFDFKGSDAKIDLSGEVMNVEAESDFQIRQIEEIIYNRLAKRGIDLRCLDKGKIDERGKRAYLSITVREGIDKEVAKKLVKKIKDSKIKVQAQVQGEQLRVSGKKRDDLQQVMALLKADDSVEVPLQFNNFRD